MKLEERLIDVKMEDELDELCAYCCEWRHEHENKSPQTICDDYPKMMRRVLKVWFHMPKKAAKTFIDGACRGNWERLHLTAMEKAASAESYADEILGEVWYCSDRWSWDRVMRIQWLYQRLRDKVRMGTGE